MNVPQSLHTPGCQSMPRDPQADREIAARAVESAIWVALVVAEGLADPREITRLLMRAHHLATRRRLEVEDAA